MSIIGNIGGQSGSGSLTKSILIVTAPTGSTVTVTKGATTKTATEKNGEWWFKNLENGEWTIRATLGGQNATAVYKIEQFGVYRTSIAYFKATINVTYPAGSTCTATDGTTTLTAPDTSGTWACIVPNAGEWTVSVAHKPYKNTVTIIRDGEVAEADVTGYYLYRHGEFYNGNAITEMTKGEQSQLTESERSIDVICRSTQSYVYFSFSEHIDMTNYDKAELRFHSNASFSLSASEAYAVGTALYITKAESSTDWGDPNAKIRSLEADKDYVLSVDISNIRNLSKLTFRANYNVQGSGLLNISITEVCVI